MNMEDYFVYQLYNKSEYSVDKFISEHRRGELYLAADNKEYNHIMANKDDFFRTYYTYMQKNIVCVQSEDDRKEFERICNGQSYIIVKTVDGQRGIGVERLSIEDKKSFEAAWQRCLKDHLVVERVLRNHEVIAQFHPASLNTIRISTVLDNKNEVHIMAASLRCGTGDNIVDNGHSDGIYASIDIDTGIIFTKAYNLIGSSFLVHPDTHVVFPGKVIPKWKELIGLVHEIAIINKELRYIGWDFVLDESGKWILLEGNEPGGIHMHQQPIDKGLYFEYKKMICG